MPAVIVSLTGYDLRKDENKISVFLCTSYFSRHLWWQPRSFLAIGWIVVGQALEDTGPEVMRNDMTFLFHSFGKVRSHNTYCLWRNVQDYCQGKEIWMTRRQALVDEMYLKSDPP
jgi:hypothetical protein